MSRKSWSVASRMRVAIVAPLVAVALIGGFVLGRRPPALLSEQPLDVRCLIEAVTVELAAAEAAQRRQNRMALFQLKDFEMEINYVARNSGTLKAEVVGVGTNLDGGSERVQKLLLRWDAIPNREESVPPLALEALQAKPIAMAAPAESKDGGCARIRRTP